MADVPEKRDGVELLLGDGDELGVANRRMDVGVHVAPAVHRCATEGDRYVADVVPAGLLSLAFMGFAGLVKQ